MDETTNNLNGDINENQSDINDEQTKTESQSDYDTKEEGYKKQIENLKKENENYRKKISLNKSVRDVKEYDSNYKVPENLKENFEKDTENNTYIKEVFKDLDATAFSCGLNINQTNAIKNEIFGIMQDLGLITDKTDEETLTERNKSRADVLGENFQKITETNLKFLDEFRVFNKNEQDLLKQSVESGSPYWTSIVDKIRGLFGRTTSEDIPESTQADGLPSDSTWLNKYKKASPEEKLRLVKQRQDAGRDIKLKLGLI